MTDTSPEALADWSVTPEQREQLEGIAQIIAQQIGSVVDSGPLEGKIGFCFQLFTWEPGFLTYVCNGNRDDMAKQLRELADVLGRRSDSLPMRSGGGRIS